jgi:hypothetical protein
MLAHRPTRNAKLIVYAIICPGQARLEFCLPDPLLIRSLLKPVFVESADKNRLIEEEMMKVE